MDFPKSSHVYIFLPILILVSKLAEIVQSEAEYVPPVFSATKTPRLAEKAYDRYRSEIISHGVARGVETTDEGDANGQDISSIKELDTDGEKVIRESFRDRQVR